MTDRPDLDQILCAINSGHAALITMTEHAREAAREPAAALSHREDVPENLANALATALDAMGDWTDDETQLRGALARFLEGWAP